MKNIFRFLGLIALAAVIGFSMTACGNGGGDGGADPALNGIWVGTNNAYIFNNGSFSGYATNAGDVTGTYSTNEGVITLKVSQGKESGNYSFIDDDTLVIGRITYKRPTIDPALVGTWKNVTAERIYYTFNNDGTGDSYYGSFVYTKYNNSQVQMYAGSSYSYNYEIEGNTLEMGPYYSTPDTYTKQE